MACHSIAARASLRSFRRTSRAVRSAQERRHHREDLFLAFPGIIFLPARFVAFAADLAAFFTVRTEREPLISSSPSWPALSPGFRFGFSSFLRCFLSSLLFRSRFQRRFFCPLNQFLRSLCVSLFRRLACFSSHFGSPFDGSGCLVPGGFRHALRLTLPRSLLVRPRQLQPALPIAHLSVSWIRRCSSCRPWAGPPFEHHKLIR